MTYCVAMCLDQGLVFVSDSRTNGGVDHIATFKKLNTFKKEGDRVIVIQSSGNLATTQSIIHTLHTRIQTQVSPNLMEVATMYDVATLVGQTMSEIIHRDSAKQQNGSNTDFGCHLLVGGQIKGEAHQLFHIYPEGNFIASTPDTPYFQIGEIKYGKPIIDRVLRMDMPLDQAMCCALISMDSTLRSNLSVGMPLDVMIYDTDSLNDTRQKRITDKDPYFQSIRQGWSEGLYNTFKQLPTYTD